MRHHHTLRTPVPDRGAVLPLVLVCLVVISMVTIAVANYTTASMRYGQVVERRADRLAAADGGLRYAIQKMTKVGHHECPSIDPPDVNGAVVTLTCTNVGAGFDDTAGYALILTGEELPAGTALMSTQGGASTDKRISGLVYMQRLAFDLQSPVRFENGQLQYSATASSTCPPSPTIDANGGDPDYIQFGIDHFGIVCTTQPWSRAASPTDDPATPDWNEQGKFSPPLIGPLPVNNPATNNPAPSMVGTCRVFVPGYYTVAPTLGSYNYFRSGNYVFDGFQLTIAGSKVTAGKVLTGNGGTQAIPNTACDAAIQGDNVANVTEAGVTFYLKNRASFEIRQNGTFEVLRRKQGKTYVSIHVLDDSLTWNDDVVLQGPGTNKDMALHGMVWAPQASITFSNVANTAEAQMLGGGVLSNIKVDASAGASGLVISVEPSDITGLVQLDSTATTSDGRSTTIRSIVDYRPSTKYAAATSWRVID
jgi:hypothetical protein